MPSAIKNLPFAALFAATLAAVLVAGFQYEVGEKTGWQKPTGKEPETYNQWASKNRFHIGDTVYFKYQKDSVLVVSSADYLNCNTSNPIAKYEDGKTVFTFDRPGFFYFISGQSNHCQSGQRLIVRVMHPSEVEAPELAPSPAAAGGRDFGPPPVSSTSKLGAVSCFLAGAPVGLCLILYLFV
ncbi:hypothetical protein ACP275_13G108400 [Erythranthe tilingii]